jgi:AraC family transcriptional regulator
LERAAWQLGGGLSVTDAAWSAGFESVEGFSRAFSRAHGCAPSRFAAGDADFRIAANNGVHFHPPTNLEVRTGRLAPGRSSRADVRRAESAAGSPLLLLLHHDRAMTDALIDAAETLDPRSMDIEVRPGHVVLAFDGPETTVRTMLDRLVWTKEVWAAAIEGRALPGPGGRTLEELRRRHQVAGARVVELVTGMDVEDRWGDVFIDTLCDPPQAFTYGAVVGHMLTFAAHRRQVVVEVLGELEATPAFPACPIEWQRSTFAPLPLDPDTLRGTATA